MFHPRPLSLAIVASIAASPFVFAASFKLPAQPLAQTIQSIASQANVQVLFAANLVAGKQAPAITGELTPQQALQQALAGSGLQLLVQDGRTFLIQPLAQAAALAPVRVEAGQNLQPEQATGPVAGLVAKKSRSATKTDSDINSTAQAITVAGSEQMRSQQSKSLAEVLRYMPGVQAEGWGNDTRMEFFYMRGFEAAADKGLYRDGLALHTYGYNGWRIEPYGLERVEVLRGPNSVLYGQANPGGLVNVVSKRPQADAANELAVTVGSFARKQLALDVGAALNEAETVRGRVVGLWREADSQTDFVFDDRAYFAPSLSWQPSAATELTLFAHYQRDKIGGNSYLPIRGTLQDNPFGTLPAKRNVGEPGNRFNTEQQSLGYELRHDFSDDIRLTHSLRYGRTDVDYNSVYGIGLEADDRTVTRNDFRVDERLRHLASDTRVQWQQSLAAAKSTLLLGVDWLRDETNGQRLWGDAPSIDAYAPVYGQPLTTPAAYHDKREVMSQLGAYLQHQLAFDNGWHTLLGLRHDRAMTRSFDHPTGERSEEKTNASSGRAGVLYRFANGFAPYLSYSESFQPQSGKDERGQAFRPTTAQQWEGGFKFGPADERWRLAVALFDLNKFNVLTRDAASSNPDAQVQQGQVRARGAELEWQGKLAAGLQLTANYSYTPTRVVKDNSGKQGKVLSISPEQLASLWLDYRQDGWLFGAGVRHIGASWVDEANTLRIPAATLLDAGISYQLKNWQAALNVQNLADKAYIGVCFEGSGCNYGGRRNVQLTGRYRW